MNVSNWLISRFSTIKFPICTRNDLVKKSESQAGFYNLGFASVAKSAFESNFPNSIIPGKRKIYGVKPLVHSKFDKFI